jgi:hypothetical protein
LEHAAKEAVAHLKGADGFKKREVFIFDELASR